MKTPFTLKVVPTGKHGSIHQSMGIKADRFEELSDIAYKAMNSQKTHSQSFVELSKQVTSLEELVVTMYLYGKKTGRREYEEIAAISSLFEPEKEAPFLEKITDILLPVGMLLWVAFLIIVISSEITN